MFASCIALILAQEALRLWPGDAPGALGAAAKDVPTLTAFRPNSPCGSAVIVCPGGGYQGLADHEGIAYARFLNRMGVTAFVLKYRLGSDGYRYPSQLDDVQRAIRIVRSRAKAWKLDPHKIGVMGSSAGGHLASMALTMSRDVISSSDPLDTVNCRPDFGILCYPVITMGEKGHAGSRDALLGPNPPASLIDETSTEKRVTHAVPPVFIWHTEDDPVVPVSNSKDFAEAMRKENRSVELHLYPHGAHGLGLGGPPDGKDLLPWTKELERWLNVHGWARKLDAVPH